MTLQDKLQILRKQKGISQEKLAEKIGISRQAVAKWEAGQSYPDINKVMKKYSLTGLKYTNVFSMAAVLNNSK